MMSQPTNETLHNVPSCNQLPRNSEKNTWSINYQKSITVAP